MVNKKVKAFQIRKTEYFDKGKILYYTKSKKVITWDKRLIKNKLGQLQLKFKFSKKGRIPITVFGYSYVFNFSDNEYYIKAKKTAFLNAYKQVPFSPDNYDIIGEKFIYIEKIKAIA